VTFNKHFPTRAEPVATGLSKLDRAVLMRLGTWVSLLMLVAGYVILFLVWK
jgi:hypothetical protein